MKGFVMADTNVDHVEGLIEPIAEYVHNELEVQPPARSAAISDGVARCFHSLL
jgi:hypothetical protein